MAVIVSGCGDGNNPSVPDLSDPGANSSGGTFSSGLETGSVNTMLNQPLGTPKYYPDEVVVLLHDNGISPSTSLIGSYPLYLRQKIEVRWGTLYRLGINDGTSVEDMVEILKNDPIVKIVEPNYIYTPTEELYFPNDPLWAYTDDPIDPKDSAYDQWGPTMVGAPIVWNEFKGTDDVVVAVIDTGVRFDHEDLHDLIWINEDEDPDDGVDNDLNGYIDDWWGWNCWQMNNDPWDDGSYASYHGTACSGVVAAIQDNERGLTGIAPGVKIMAIKTDLSGYGNFVSTVVEAMNYAAVNEADIASMSFRGYDYSELMEIACDDAWADGQGVILMGAIGNESTTDLCYPNAYESVMAIGGTCPFTEYLDPRDEKRITSGEDGYYWGSNYGDHLTVMGFGAQYTTTYGGHYDSYWDGYYNGFFGGTSNACPMTAGVMALIKSYFPSEDGNWYWQRIEETADDLDVPGYDIQTGHGRVNAVRALYGSDRYTDLEDPFGFVPLIVPDEVFDTIHDSPANPHHDVEDLYRFTTISEGFLIIDLDIFTWGEDLDIALYADQDMTVLVQDSTGENHYNSSTESIFMGDVDPGVEYFLKVYSPGEGNSTTYGLLVHNAANSMYVTGESIIPPFVHQSGEDIPFLKLTCEIGYQATLNGLNISKHGSVDNGNFAKVRLYKDSNNNGEFDRFDQLLAEEDPPGTNRAVLGGFSEFWMYDHPIILFVTADLSLSPDGATIWLSLESYKDISTEEGTEAHYTQFPIASDTITIGTDSDPPYWLTTTGAQEAIGRYNSATLTFNEAVDDLMPPVIYNVYYTSDPLPFDIGTAMVINNVSFLTGDTTDFKCQVPSLEKDVEWHFVLRAEDQADNEDDNVVVVSCTPGGAGDPTAPEVIGSFGLDQPSDITLNDNVLLITDSYSGVKIFDRTDPVSLVDLGYWDADWTYAIDCNDTHAFVTTWTEFNVVDITDPSNPYLTDSEAYNYGYVVAEDQGWAYPVNYYAELMPVNVADPDNIIPYSYVSFPGWGYPYDIDFYSNYIYVANYQSGVMPLDKTVPEAPVMGSYFDSSNVIGLYVESDTLYTVNNQSGTLTIWDLSGDPMTPSLLGWTSSGPGNNGNDIVVVDDYAYMTRPDYGLVVYDVSDPSNPTDVGDLFLSGSMSIATDGTLFYVIANDTLYIIL